MAIYYIAANKRIKRCSEFAYSKNVPFKTKYNRGINRIQISIKEISSSDREVWKYNKWNNYLPATRS